MSIFDDNYIWSSELKEEINEASEGDLMEHFNVLSKKWTVSETNIIEDACKNLNIKNVYDLDMGILQMEFEKAIYQATYVYNKFKNTISEISDKMMIEWDRIYEVIYYSERLLRDISLLSKTNNENHSPLENEDPDVLFKYARFTDDSKKTPYQCLLLYLLDQFSEEGFTRNGGNLYKPVFKNGFNTHAWKVQCSLKEYIYRKTDHKVNYNQWKNATANGASNINNAEKYFTEFIGPELPALKKDRYLFAFKNGNYISMYNTAPEGEPPVYKDLFVPYGTEHPYITSYSVAAKYHDKNFDNFDQYSDEDWFKIINHCPTFKSILDYQEFTEEIQKWLCVFIGRMCFNIGDLDNWQVLLYLLGQAGTGKSTIIMKIIQRFYDEEDVGVFANNIDAKYGIKPHASKFIVLAPEISENFKMEQTDWQLLVEGGRNTYAEKYKNDETIDWRIHLLMGGNKIMRYKNNSESVSRRTVVANFWKKVVNTDTEIDKVLLKEIPIILKLCVSGYYNAVRTYGKKGIWNVLPKYFHENKEDMEQTTNSLQNFLKSGKVVFDRKLYMPMKIFQQAFNEHCRDNNLPREAFTKDFYNAIFINNNIKIVSQGTHEYPQNSGITLKRMVFLKGIDIPSEDNDLDDPE